MQKVYLTCLLLIKSNNFDVNFFYLLKSQEFKHFIVYFSVNFVKKQVSNIAGLMGQNMINQYVCDTLD